MIPDLAAQILQFSSKTLDSSTAKFFIKKLYDLSEERHESISINTIWDNKTSILISIYHNPKNKNDHSITYGSVGKQVPNVVCTISELLETVLTDDDIKCINRGQRTDRNPKGFDIDLIYRSKVTIKQPDIDRIKAATLKYRKNGQQFIDSLKTQLHNATQ